MAFWLKSPEFLNWRDAQANGVNIQNLRPSEVQEIKIPLPNFSEQKRISALLSRAERLGKLRRTAYSLTNELLQSVFFEMFGNPMINEKRWKLSKLSETFSIKPQIGTPDPAHDGGKYPVVRVGEIGNTWVELERSQRITLDAGDLERFRLQADDFLLARAIGSDSHL
jgi:type I restriction enzyme S subunit